jgi:hypothetical protein
MKRIFYLISLFLFSFLTVFSQYTQTIRGTITDQDSKQPLLGVNVVITTTDPQKGTTSDPDGAFRFEDIPVGRHEIQFSSLGYKPVLINVNLSSVHEIVLETEMVEMVYQGEEVIVKATQSKNKPINQMALISARSFSVEETERYAGSWGDPARMASNYAGVLAANESRNDIIIRGNSPLGLLWRLEGQNVPNPNHFGAFGTTGGPISMLNNNLLRNSDFYTGAFPAEYGNALSGAFDLNMRTGNNQHREYLVQIGLAGLELGAEGPFSKTHNSSYLVNYRYSFLGLLEKLGISYGPEGTVPEYQDITYKVDLPTGKAGKFSFFGIAGNSNVKSFDSKKDSVADFTFSDYGYDFSYYTGMMTNGINHVIPLSQNTRLTTSLAVSGSFEDYKFDSISMLDRSITLHSRSYYKEWQYSAGTEINTKINTKNHLKAGISADVFQPNFQDSTLQGDGTYRTGSKADGTMALYQGFVELRHRLNDLFTIYSGLHSQYFGLNGSFIVEPRASIQWQFLKKQSVSLGYGLHSQLQPHQIYFNQRLNDQTGEYEDSGNRDLDFTKSHHFVLGYNYVFSEDFRLKFETYYQHLYDVPVEQVPSHNSLLNYGADFYIPEFDSLVNKGTGRNYGVELTLEKFFSNNYYFLITTSLFEAKFKGSDNIERNTVFNSNYVVNVLGGYEFEFGSNTFLSVSPKFTVAGGKRYTPYSVELGENDIYYMDYDYDRAFEKQYPTYMRLDMRLTLRWNAKKTMDEWILDIQNITNRENIFYESLNRLTGEVETEYFQKFAWMMMWRIRF